LPRSRQGSTASPRRESQTIAGSATQRLGDEAPLTRRPPKEPTESPRPSDHGFVSSVRRWFTATLRGERHRSASRRDGLVFSQLHLGRTRGRVQGSVSEGTRRPGQSSPRVHQNPRRRSHGPEDQVTRRWTGLPTSSGRRSDPEGAGRRPSPEGQQVRPVSAPVAGCRPPKRVTANRQLVTGRRGGPACLPPPNPEGKRRARQTERPGRSSHRDLDRTAFPLRRERRRPASRRDSPVSAVSPTSTPEGVSADPMAG
jgi:hypothetical protein